MEVETKNKKKKGSFNPRSQANGKDSVVLTRGGGDLILGERGWRRRRTGEREKAAVKTVNSEGGRKMGEWFQGVMRAEPQGTTGPVLVLRAPTRTGGLK